MTRTAQLDRLSVLAVSHDRLRIATAHKGGGVRVWDLSTFEPVTPILKQGAEVRHMSFSPACPSDPIGGQYLITGCNDGTARLWNTRTAQAVMLLRHRAPVAVATFSPDGRQILTGSESGSAVLWNIPRPDSRSTDDLHRMAMLLSSSVSDGHGGVESVTSDRLAVAWQPLRGRIRTDPAIEPIRLRRPKPDVGPTLDVKVRP